MDEWYQPSNITVKYLILQHLKPYQEFRVKEDVD